LLHYTSIPIVFKVANVTRTTGSTWHYLRDEQLLFAWLRVSIAAYLCDGCRPWKAKGKERRKQIPQLMSRVSPRNHTAQPEVVFVKRCCQTLPNDGSNALQLTHFRSPTQQGAVSRMRCFRIADFQVEFTNPLPLRKPSVRP
jgi:hypothetical protein